MGVLIHPDGKIIVTINEKKHVWMRYEDLFYDVRAEQEQWRTDRVA